MMKYGFQTGGPGGDSYGYGYDSIGNRVWSAENAATNLYAANALNQYTNVTGGAAVSPAYDPDGNLTGCTLPDGVWRFFWDAENRLAAAERLTFDAAGFRIRVRNVYDHRSRRVAKQLQRRYYREDGGMLPDEIRWGFPAVSARHIYDGWNIAAETAVDAVAGTTNAAFYTWGPDLSGTLQGAGGVDGLLAETKTTASTTNTYYALGDANGNVTEYLSANGTVVAHFEYSPFGGITVQSGDMADIFTLRFSTKPFDAETGLIMYQLRPYEPGLGRWLSKDPIEEKGGANVYCWAGNNAITFFDILGLKWTQQLVGSDFYVNFNVGVRGSLNAVDVFKGASAHFEFPGWRDPEFDKTGEGCACVKEETGILNVHVKWWKVKEGVPTPADFRNTEGWKNLRKFHNESDLQMRTEHVGTFSETTINNMNWHEETEVGMNKILYDNTLGIVETRIEECRCANLKKKFQYTYQLKKYINFDLAKRMFARNTQKIADEFDRNFGFGGMPDDQGNLIQRMPRPRAEFKISDYNVWLKPDIW